MREVASTNSDPQAEQKCIVTELRRMIPRRPLLEHEAYRLAREHAARLRQMIGDTSPNFSEKMIARIPHLRIERVADMPDSGSSGWEDGAWVIRVRSTEPIARQHFTVAHELKHVIDNHLAVEAYSALSPDRSGRTPVESICDYFAAELLMPEHWVRSLWRGGSRCAVALAAKFGVSQQAMNIRLNQLGLKEDISCRRKRQKDASRALAAQLASNASRRRIKRLEALK